MGRATTGYTNGLPEVAERGLVVVEALRLHRLWYLAATRVNSE